MRHKIPAQLLLTACLCAVALGLTTTLNRGIYQISKFVFASPNWSFTAVDLAHHDCRVNITNDGTLYYKGDNEYCWSQNFSFKVIATNHALRVNLSFSIALTSTEHGLKQSIPSVNIDLYTHVKNLLIENDEEFPVLHMRLSQILPIELADRIPSSNNITLSERCAGWSMYMDKSTSPCRFELDGKLRVAVHLHVLTPRRAKRQMFSNLDVPQFVNAPYNVSIHEELALATQVIQVEAIDTDEGSAGDVLYSLHADVDQRSLDVFLINETSGLVTTNGRVDREDIAIHKFTVRAQDQGSPANTAETMLTIMVEDFNDHPPIFEKPVYNINVSETRTVNSIITRIQAADADIGKNRLIRYSIINAAEVTEFLIDTATGDLSIARQLNRENISSYAFVVKAEDQPDNVADRLSSTVMVNILVIDDNDNSPEFTQPSYVLDVSESVNISSAPVIIGRISATDPDMGSNSRITYSITSGNPMPAVFDIVPDTGDLRVVAPLDRDVRGGEEYNLRVKARDGGRPPLYSVVSVKVKVVDVNDNAPKIKFLSYLFKIPEDHPAGEPIATVEATDADEGDNQLLVYSIIPVREGAGLPFTIDSGTGVITNTAELDREDIASREEGNKVTGGISSHRTGVGWIHHQSPEECRSTSRPVVAPERNINEEKYKFEFVVRVDDSGNPQRYATANVTLDVLDVNDNKPEFTASIYTKRISEDIALQQEVITVTATDRDENDVITYSIVAGDPTNDFIMTKEQQYGVIRVNKALSYDRISSYSLRVRAADKADQFSECTIKVNLTDKNEHPPIFIQDDFTFHISEAEGKGASIGIVEAQDLDIELNGKLTYFFSDSEQPLPFFINNSTGEIIVNDTLDRDNPLTSRFYVEVIARDNGIPPRQTVPAPVYVIIDDVNDNAPEFSLDEYTATVLEDKSIGSSVITVSATDKDQPGTPNSQVRYTFEGGDDGNGSFSIEESGGTIRIKQPLDRERVDQYNLIVVATDMSADDRRSSSVLVSVTVHDVNDNSPQFESEIIIRRIFENKPIRSPVQPPIRATDPDLGDNAKVTFKLVSGDTFAFSLQDQSDNSFILYSKVSLDYESLRKNYTLEVQASSEHMITKAKVIIKLQDVNDNSPVLKDFTIVINNYGSYFPEGVIGRVPAFDPDESDRRSLLYTVKSGNEASFFTLNSATGEIVLNRALGSDRPTEGEFIVQVSDILNKVNATCRLVYRLITDDMLLNSVTLRLDDMTTTTFMTSMYIYTVQALAEVLGLIPSQIYILDIWDDTEVDTSLHNPVLNVSFAAIQQVNGVDVYLDQDFIKEQIYRKLDLLKNLSAVTIMPFDDTLCVMEPCFNYRRCSITLQFAEAASFIHSEAMLFRPIKTTAIHACDCSSGFGGQNISYICDIEINLCYSNPCMNSATCQQIEDGFKCLCPTGYKGERCEYDISNGDYSDSCPQQVCQGQGSSCVDLIMGGFACHSPTGRCEETESYTDTCALRTATFLPNSYLMFPALTSRAMFNLQVSFASRRKSGLLLYNGRYNHQHDFIALELINHTVVFTMSFGNESYSVSVGKQYGLNDGQWHTVTVDYRSWTLTISLDQCDVGLSLFQPQLYTHPCAMRIKIMPCKDSRRFISLCYLDLTGPMLVGGLPEYLDIDRLTYNYFEGCMRDLYVNHEHVDFNSAVTDHNTQKGCVYKSDSCINMPCRNQGTCISSWGTYRCICPEERSGKDCGLRTSPSYTYYGQGYLKYTSELGNVSKPWYNSFVFKTTVDNRPLLRVDLEHGKTIEYTLEGGYIVFRYEDYRYPFDEALVNDDSWHHFEMRLIRNSANQGQILLQLDYGELQLSKPLDNSLDGLGVRSLWVGGNDDTSSENPGFSGCIKDVMLSDSLAGPADVMYAVKGCAKPVTCNLRCTPGTSACQVGWETSTCQCNEGLVGPRCESTCSQQYSPCQNGAQCVVDRETSLGYQCVCTDQYQGTYCENKRQTQCLSAWWGSPVCGPCNCSAELNYNSQCDRETGECTCKTSYYRPTGSDKCEPCSCYYSPAGAGALFSSCEQGSGQCTCREGISGRRCDTCVNPFAEATKSGCRVLYDSCPKTHVSGIWWTRTKFGVLRIESCPPDSVGNATRVCQDNVLGWLSPNLTGCTSSNFLTLNKTLMDLELRSDDNASIPIHAVGTTSYMYIAPQIITDLKNSTDKIDSLYANDLLISVKILREVLLREKSAIAFNLTHTKDRYFTDNLIQVMSRLLRPSLTLTWVQLSNTSEPTLLLDLLKDFDDYMGNLAYNMATKFVSIGMDPFQLISENIVLGLDTMRGNGAKLPKYNNIKKESTLFDEVTSIKLPNGLFSEQPNGLLKDKAVGGYILYSTAGEILVAMASSKNNPYASDIDLYNEPILGARSYGGLTVNSVVLSLVLQQGESKAELNEPIEITYKLRDSSLNRNPECVYLNSDMKWSGEFCDVKEIHEDRIVCSCNHLSIYALITDFPLNSGASGRPLGVHMYVSAVLSLICLVFTLIVFICLKDLKSNYIYNQINIQLCFCLAVIVFIAGADSYSNQVACQVVAVMLQFFVLALFAWLFVDSLHLYRILTEKRHVDGDAMQLYFVIGYVGPVVVTGLSLGLSSEDFGGPTLCWLDITESMIWSLAGPTIFCCIAIGVLLTFAMAISCKDIDSSSHMTTARKNDIKKFKSAVWIAMIFMPLVACTWLFALLSANFNDVDSFDYIFSAFTLITAVFSLFAHVVFSKQGREELQRRWRTCQGHGTLEESDTLDKPNGRGFGGMNSMNLAGMFGTGSESSTTSNSRLTSSVPSTDHIAYRRGQSSTSSDIPTYSQYSRRRRTTSDASSESETDSEIRTEREKDIELASSHTSDEDDAIPPITSISPVVASPEQAFPQSKFHHPPAPKNEKVMMSTFNQGTGYAPPPPYFGTPGRWGRISESTSSTHGSESRLDGLSLQSSNRNQLTERPDVLPPLTGRYNSSLTPDMPARISPTQYNQHINRSFLNSPSSHDQMISLGRPPVATGADSNTESLPRRPQNSASMNPDCKQSQTPRPIESPIDFPMDPSGAQVAAALPNLDKELNSPTSRKRKDEIVDTDNTSTALSGRNQQDKQDVFVPPPPDLSHHLTTQSSSDSTSEGVLFVETNLDVLSDVNNETEV